MQQVKATKFGDKINRQGALFELCGLLILDGNEHYVLPAKDNQPGFDGVLTISAQQQMRISIKNYGISERHRIFLTKASILEQDIVRLLKKYNYPPATVMIDSPVVYPEKKEWELLDKQLENIFAIKRNDSEPFTAITEGVNVFWTIIIHKTADTGMKYHPSFNTYTAIITSAYHPNEHLNLFNKLEDACANLVKHSRAESEELINSLLLHLPVSASLEKCEEWIKDFFIAYPEKPITMVMLYQPAVALDITTNVTLIQHSYRIYVNNEKFGRWNTAATNFTFTIPIGRVSTSPTIDMIVAEYPNGERNTISVNHRYFYQRGQHYLRMEPDGKGGFVGNIQKLGSGMFTNVVVEVPGQPGQAVIGGKFAPTDDLLIL
ncbi:hypothetical protein [Mucilaginibacter sp. PAMB04168]|uniref:hypothetical protein n=1 Tax=Mucilaginibacter sp. PAMB04168 TaxID=3138567 RepID=UPI0031F685EF